jgi:hypothetical protein
MADTKSGSESTTATTNTAAPQPTEVAIEAANTLASLGNFVSPDVRAELEKQAGDVKPTNQEDDFVQGATDDEEGGDPFANKPAKPAVAATDKPEGSEEEEEPAPVNATDKKDDKADDKKAESEKKNIFGLKKKGGEKKAETVNIENLDHVLGVVSKNFGMEIKAPAELPQFFEKAQGWRKDSEQLKQTSTRLSTIERDIQSLPPEFFTAFEMIAAGKDYRDAFQKPKFDLSLTADKQDKRALIEHYFPDEFTDADFAEATPGTALKIATQAATDKYNIEKSSYETKRAGLAKDIEARQTAYKSSVASSVTTLKQSFPEADENVVNTISTLLEGGADQIKSLFIDENGSVKTDAAERLMLALHGKDVLMDLSEVAANQRESEINEEILTKGADTPKPKKTSSAPAAQISEEEQAELDRLNNLVKTQKKQNSVF